MIGKRRFVSSVLVVFASVLAVASASNVLAEEPTPVSGTFSATISPFATRSADGNTFIDFTFVEQFQGTISGTRVGTGLLIIHPDGTVNVRDSGLFSGSIDGSSGSAVLSASISGTFASIAANFVVTDGTGGLAGVHVQGTGGGGATGPTTFAGTYSGQMV